MLIGWCAALERILMGALAKKRAIHAIGETTTFLFLPVVAVAKMRKGHLLRKETVDPATLRTLWPSG